MLVFKQTNNFTLYLENLSIEYLPDLVMDRFFIKF